IASRHITSYNARSHHTTSHHATSHHARSHRATSPLQASKAKDNTVLRVSSSLSRSTSPPRFDPLQTAPHAFIDLLRTIQSGITSSPPTAPASPHTSASFQAPLADPSLHIMSICRITGRQILDSRGNPTIEVDLVTGKGEHVLFHVPPPPPPLPSSFFFYYLSLSLSITGLFVNSTPDSRSRRFCSAISSRKLDYSVDSFVEHFDFILPTREDTIYGPRTRKRDCGISRQERFFGELEKETAFRRLGLWQLDCIDSSSVTCSSSSSSSSTPCRTIPLTARAKASIALDIYAPTLRRVVQNEAIRDELPTSVGQIFSKDERNIGDLINEQFVCVCVCEGERETGWYPFADRAGSGGRIKTPRVAD
ncbi:unnamed protein product, partial [Protopolystoma xenopodis]